MRAASPAEKTPSSLRTPHRSNSARWLGESIPPVCRVSWELAPPAVRPSAKGLPICGGAPTPPRAPRAPRISDRLPTSPHVSLQRPTIEIHVLAGERLAHTAVH